MLTKKDFKAVAEIIEGNRGQGVEYTLDNIASELANYFAAQNPCFDRERFMQACGLDSNEDQCNRCEICTNTPENNKCPLFK